MCVHCWLLVYKSQWVCDNGELSAVESVGMSYVYQASVPLRWSVAGVTSESVTTAGRDNEAASEKVTYRLTTQCLVWLLRPDDSQLTAIAIMWWSWQGEWSRRERRVISHHHRVAVSRCIQHYQRPTPFSLTPRGLAALHVRLLSEIHSTQAWLFISIVLHGKSFIIITPAGSTDKNIKTLKH